MTSESTFFDTEAGQFVSRAKCYLEGAYVLNGELQRAHNKMLFAPALHLAGHGLELLLKGCLIHNGVPKDDVVKHGHRLNKMWPLPELSQLRAIATISANIVHQEALAEGAYPDAADVADPALLFEEYRQALGDLHAEAGSYPLRYPTDDNRLAPRAPLLVRTLWRTADDYVRRPEEFLFTAP